MKRTMSLAAAALAAASLVRSAALNDAGEVSFPNSGAPAAQAPFLHGLALLHDFEYGRAEKDFQEAEKIDPSFAMAYWGEAMTHTHPIWMEQDAEAGRKALARLAPDPKGRAAKAPTQREKAYLGALEILYGEGSKNERDFRYAEAMRRVHEEYPNDPDASCFYALALLGTAHNGRDVPVYMRAGAILEDVFAGHPHHPGAAHYLIHSFDDPVHAPLGLAAARVYSKIAPDAAHAQHMTSHIFLALGMWDEVVAANETAVAVVNRQRSEAGKPATFCGHYAFWLEYGYLEQGRYGDARRILEACRIEAAAAPSAPPRADEAIRSGNHALDSYVEMRARYALDAEGGKAPAAPPPVDPSRGLSARFADVYLRGYFAGRHRDAVETAARLEDLRQLAPRIAVLQEKAGEPVQTIPSIEIEELSGLLALASGRAEDGIAVLRKAAAEEDALPSAFGPPAVDKPSTELLGEVLLEAHRPGEARAAFEASLARAPRRTASLLGRLRSDVALGDAEAAARDRAELSAIWRSADFLPDAAR